MSWGDDDDDNSMLSLLLACGYKQKRRLQFIERQDYTLREIQRASERTNTWPMQVAAAAAQNAANHVDAQQKHSKSKQEQ